jgi:hypothetical protein
MCLFDEGGRNTRAKGPVAKELPEGLRVAVESFPVVYEGGPTCANAARMTIAVGFGIDVGTAWPARSSMLEPFLHRLQPTDDDGLIGPPSASGVRQVLPYGCHGDPWSPSHGTSSFE